MSAIAPRLAVAAINPTATVLPDEERQRISGWLSFISERDQDLEVYLIRPSDGLERRLTRRRGGDYNGPASPDGTQLLIMSVEESPMGTRQSLRCLRLSDGNPVSEPRPLGPSRAVVRHPAWSPDGELVVFEGDSNGYRDLFRIRRDGTGLRRLTNNPEGNFEPAVAPRGDALAFVSSRDRMAELYLMHLDGSDPRRITRTPRDEWSPRWSSDGALLAFASDREGADRLYLMRADGTAVRRVSDSTLDSDEIEESPAFSPQGSLLSYVVRSRDGRVALYVLDVATGTRRPVAAGLTGELAEPAWSLDSRYLAFTLRRADDVQIYIARSDGTGATRLTTAAGPNWNPRWIPTRAAP